MAARSELDQAKRCEMYRKMQGIVSGEGSTIFPMYNTKVAAIANGLGTPETVGSNWSFDGVRAVERWWFA